MKSNSSSVKRRGTFPMVLGLLLIAAAVALTLYNLWDDHRAGEAAKEILEELETVWNQEAQTTDTEIGKVVENAGTEENSPKQAVVIDGNLYIAELMIPSLGIRLPIMADWSKSKLKIAPCAYSGSYETNDLVIAGHNYVQHFGPIKQIKINSDVYLRTANGTELHYLADGVEVLQPTDIEGMTVADDWDLTLFTCTIGGQTRYAVRCSRVL